MRNKLKYCMLDGDPKQKIPAEGFVDNQRLTALKRHLEEKKKKHLFSFLLQGKHEEVAYKS